MDCPDFVEVMGLNTIVCVAIKEKLALSVRVRTRTRTQEPSWPWIQYKWKRIFYDPLENWMEQGQKASHKQREP